MLATVVMHSFGASLVRMKSRSTIDSQPVVYSSSSGYTEIDG